MSFSNTLSIWLGYLVVCLWIVALLPQVYLNQRRRSASGLAPSLVVLWLIGDGFGTIASFLTDQLPFQRINSIFHLLVDFVLFCQWLAFSAADRERIRIEDKREAEIYFEQARLKRDRRLSLEQALALHDESLTPMHASRERPFTGARVPVLPPLLARTKSERRSIKRKGRKTIAAVIAGSVLVVFLGIIMTLRLKTHLLDHVLPTPLSLDRHNIGRAIAWICVSMYVISRGPQILHNARRQSCQGLSIALFFLATVANVSYISSVVLSDRARRKDGTWNSAFFTEALPFICTAGGALLFDQVILAQWFMYSGWRVDPRNRLEPTLSQRQEQANQASTDSGANTPNIIRPFHQNSPSDYFERQPLLKSSPLRYSSG